jgi:hypothetical protein
MAAGGLPQIRPAQGSLVQALLAQPLAHIVVVAE